MLIDEQPRPIKPTRLLVPAKAVKRIEILRFLTNKQKQQIINEAIEFYYQKIVKEEQEKKKMAADRQP